MPNAQKDNLVVVLNSQKVIEFFRNQPLSNKQNNDLQTLDNKLDAGIHTPHQDIANPTMQDKATFMANLLVTALLEDDESKSALACTYLATRFVDLKQIKANSQTGKISIQLIYDQEYQEQVPIKFIPKNKLD